MDVLALDQMEEQLASSVLESGISLDNAISAVARSEKHTQAKSLLFAAIVVCADIDAIYGTDSLKRLQISHKRYQTVAVLAADICALETPDPLCKDLLEYWETTDSALFR